jgi:hypothetical protein
MKTLAAIAILLAFDASADSLYIDGATTSYYFVGSDLVIDGTHATMSATSVAIGDNFGEVIARGSFDSEPWTWAVDLNNAPMDGAGECSLVMEPPDAVLRCE